MNSQKCRIKFKLAAKSYKMANSELVIRTAFLRFPSFKLAEHPRMVGSERNQVTASGVLFNFVRKTCFVVGTNMMKAILVNYRKVSE